MQRVLVLIGVIALIASTGFSEILITAQDYAVDSDVVLESAVKEIKAIPQDTINVVGDAVKYVGDETAAAANGVAAVFKDDPKDAVRKNAALETASAWDSSDDILFRSYTVSPNVGKLLMKNANGTEGPAIDVSGFFNTVPFNEECSAYYLPKLNRLMVRQTMANMLAIENELSDYHMAQRNLTGHQVEIETKFIEVGQQTLNELGFNWEFKNDRGGPLELFSKNLLLPANTKLFSDGLRTASSALNGASSDSINIFRDGDVDVGLVIKALEQADDTDVLSAPRIVTRDGKPASIQVGEERAVPKEFIVGSQQTSLYVEHSGWKNELMGVQLDVTPVLLADNLINLKLKPRVIDLIGYDDYQISPDNATLWPISGWQYSQAVQQGRYPVLSRTVDGAYNAIGEVYDVILSAAGYGGDVNDTANLVTPISGAIANNQTANPGQGYYDQHRMWAPEELIQVPSLHGQMPYFRVRELETEVTVADGNTVAMGGLIYDKLETFRDKVPVLGSIPFIGRLFRSEGERSVKRNLMIFVTATQVDVNGQRSADIVLNN